MKKKDEMSGPRGGNAIFDLTPPQFSLINIDTSEKGRIKDKSNKYETEITKQDYTE